MQSRKFRKSRKMRKTRKVRSRRGGVPAPINEPISERIYFRTYQDEPDFFNPNVERPDSIKEIFSSALIEHMRRDDPNYTFESNSQVLGLPVIIQRIRGEEVVEIFRGEIPHWNNDTITNFLSELQPGDRIRLTIAPP